MLSCSCDDYDDADWFHDGGSEVAPLKTRRWRKCHSCEALIRPGDDAKEFVRWRHAGYDTIEERIYGEGGEVPMPSRWLCDRCAGLYESLDSLGFCDLLGQNLVDVAREYGQMQRAAGVFKGQMVVNAVHTASLSHP